MPRRSPGTGQPTDSPADRSSGPPADRHAQLHAEFRWHVPERFNLAEVCCGRWARSTPEAIAVHHERDSGERSAYTFARLQADVNRLANLLAGLGVQRSDRVAIVMPQRYETVVSHMAIYQLGAVAMPLSMLFGPEALAYRLQDSAAAVARASGPNSIDNGMATAPSW